MREGKVIASSILADKFGSAVDKSPIYAFTFYPTNVTKTLHKMIHQTRKLEN